MSQILTLELNDRVFAAIQQQSENIGIPPERLVATLVEQNFTQIFRTLLTDTEKEVRRAKFERHFGEIDLGFATDIDNESIDADLAKEYASNHEEG
ncbi:hypothetical protein BCD67_04090 [Oscillatoriales cyanobacterium USR001]|nr:hypothetical protein BCD67_04090 [Oscillatoriales cyanobacterium USR001]